MLFKNRFDAAEQLAGKLQKYKGRKEVIILVIPRGALQLGNVLAKKLHLPLDIVLTKKIAHTLTAPNWRLAQLASLGK